jgi:hypothetical protein
MQLPPSKQPPLAILPIWAHLLMVSPIYLIPLEIQVEVSGDYITSILVNQGEWNMTFGTLVEKDRGICKELEKIVPYVNLYFELVNLGGKLTS